MKSSAHVATCSVVKTQEKLLRSLKRILETNDERVHGVGEDISFCFGVLNEVLAHYLLFVQDLHGIQVSCFNFASVWHDVEFFDDVNVSERSLTKLCSDSEVIWTYFLFFKAFESLSLFFSALLVVLVTLLPKFDELLLPSHIIGKSLCLLLFLLFLFLLLDLVSLELLLPVSLDVLQQLLLVMINLLKLFVHVFILHHQLLHRIDSVVVTQHSIECCPCVLRRVVARPINAKDGFKHLSRLKIHGNIAWNVAKLVLEERVCLGFFKKI
jgi:hypothetical protein